MQTLSRTLAASLAFSMATGAAFAATPAPFTAKYQVMQGDQTIGQATITLATSGNGQWTYVSKMVGTGGIAAMLGANSTETSRFRWTGNSPETLSYDASLQGLKSKQRHLTVDPSTHQVSVDDDNGKGPRQYAGAAGMVDRNTLPYALGLALSAGKQDVTLPVAVKQRIENQEFKVSGTEAVTVPAGSFQAQKMTRSDDATYGAWYVPAKYLLPVKLSQHEGGDLTLELVSYSQQ